MNIHILDHESWEFFPKWDAPSPSVGVPLVPTQYITLQYFVKNFLFVGAPTRVHTTYKDEISVDYIDRVLEEHPEIDIFACNLECFYDKNGLLTHIEHICGKYPHVYFILFYNETHITVELDSKRNNILYVMNSFSTRNLDEENKRQQVNNKIVSYYLMNSYLQENLKTIYSIYIHNSKFRKVKKYNFFNGVHKPHRFAAYDMIKKHNMLDDGFFSYLDYANFTKDETHLQHTAEFLDIPTDKIKEYVSTFEIPYLVDRYEPVGHPGDILVPFMIPTLYSWHSYISITSETYYLEDPNIVNMSEKSFKAFSGFNIPLIYGQPHLVDHLRELGFDMFDDLFDNTPTIKKSDTLSKLDKNLQVIKNMSLKELHEFYVNNWNRVEHNFLLLVNEMKERDFRRIRDNAARTMSIRQHNTTV